MVHTRDLDLNHQISREIFQALKVHKNTLRYNKQCYINKYGNVDDMNIFLENTTYQNLQKVDI